METSAWIAIGALIVSAASLLGGVILARSPARHDAYAELDSRVKDLTKQLADCQAENARYSRENINLMRRLFELERRP